MQISISYSLQYQINMFLMLNQIVTVDQDVIYIYSAEYIKIQVQDIINIMLKYT